MEETRNVILPWREALGKLTTDPQERQRVIEALGIHQITLTRWITGKSTPRRESLRTLLRTFPDYYQKLFPSLQEEFPDFFREETISEALVAEIPPAFYARVFKTYITSPAMLRSEAICTLVLQQIINHLDPHQIGMAAMIAHCVTPAEDAPVRSLRITTGRGTPPWNHLENFTQLLGAESPTGHAVRSGHLIALQNEADLEQWLSISSPTPFGSVVCCPLLQYDRVAGCLILLSARPYTFSALHVDLIQSYTDLLLLGFEPDECFPFDRITLGIMPPLEEQLPLVANFQQRVIQRIIQASQDGQLLTRLQAEAEIWREIEKDLLLLSAESINNTNNTNTVESTARGF